MTTTVLVAGLLGAGVAAGLLVFLYGLLSHKTPTAVTTARWGTWWQHFQQRTSLRWNTAALVGGLLAGWLTGWVVGGLLVALAAWTLPRVLGGDRTYAYRVARIEAIAAWTEMLRDTLSAAAGLEQAITATVDTAPAAIRDDVRELAMRIERGDRLPDALRELADDLADPIADLVLSALVLASGHQARQLAELLGELATEAREQVSMRLRVEAGRARTRTSVRVIVGTTLSFAVGLVVLNRGYLDPYDGLFGQLMLLLVGALFGLAFWWLDRITRSSEPERFLTELTARQEAHT